MVTRMNIYGATDVGRVRTNNEDCYIALVGDECPAGIDALLIVADGMGGHAAGEVASKMAVEGMVDKLVGEEDYLTSLEGAGFGAALGKILEEVSGEVYVAGQSKGWGQPALWPLSRAVNSTWPISGTAEHICFVTVIYTS